MLAAIPLLSVRDSGMLRLFMVLLGAACAVYGILPLLSRRSMRERTRMWISIARRVMEAGFILWLISFIIIEFIIVSNRRADAEWGADYLLVCGAGLEGSYPKPAFRTRLDRAATYYKLNTGVTIIVTGGQGVDEDIPEALAGARYLIAAGVPEEIILIEDKSTSTAENIRFSMPLIPEGASVVVVTNEFHNYRAVTIARKNGLDAYGLPSETPGLWPKVMLTFREYFAVVMMYLGRW